MTACLKRTNQVLFRPPTWHIPSHFWNKNIWECPGLSASGTLLMDLAYQSWSTDPIRLYQTLRVKIYLLLIMGTCDYHGCQAYLALLWSIVCARLQKLMSGNIWITAISRVKTNVKQARKQTATDVVVRVTGSLLFLDICTAGKSLGGIKYHLLYRCCHFFKPWAQNWPNANLFFCCHVSLFIYILQIW